MQLNKWVISAQILRLFSVGSKDLHLALMTQFYLFCAKFVEDRLNFMEDTTKKFHHYFMKILDFVLCFP